MTNNGLYGFRVTESPYNERKVVDWSAANAAYSRCDELANVHQPAYLSAFQFPEEFRTHMKEHGSTRGYAGRCWSRWLWFDIDRDDNPDAALEDTRRLVGFLMERYFLDEELLIWFSGSKGFHVGLPTSLWQPEPSPMFNKVCRKFAENLAGQCDVTIDSSVYDTVRLFRAPNSRHQKTGLYKRPFTVDGLFLIDAEGIRSLAAVPMPFVIPVDPPISDLAVNDWLMATEAATAMTVTRPSGTVPDRLNRLTREFLLHGAEPGDRHRVLYSAARNLGEFGCTFELALALLEPPARESGLPPTDIRRQIECGLADQAVKDGAS